MSANLQFESRAFGKNVLIYSFGQGVLLLVSAVLAFVIPKYLSVSEYGYWHLFILYSAFTSLLHLGFNDGLLIRWAGKSMSQIEKEFRPAFSFLLFQQIMFFFPIALLLWIFLHPPLLWVALFVLVFAFINNVAYFFQYTSQAVKRFKGLTSLNVGRGLSFLVLIMIMFFTGHKQFHAVITAFLFSHLLLLTAFLIWYRKYLLKKTKPIPTWEYGKKNIHTGFFVLLGNLVLILFLTMDRLVVGSFFTIKQFAIFAFAVAVTNIVYTFVKAISDVFFPFISGTASPFRNRAYQLGETTIILSWSAFIFFYFPIIFVIERYLPHYMASLPLLKILLCAVGFGSLVFILHVNYYKLHRKQRQYFLRALFALTLSIGLNIIAILIFGTLESVAVASLLSFSFWYAINEMSLRQILGKKISDIWGRLAIIILYIGAFWLSASIGKGLIIGGLSYVIFYCLITRLFHWKETKKVAISFKEIASQVRIKD